MTAVQLLMQQSLKTWQAKIQKASSRSGAAHAWVAALQPTQTTLVKQATAPISPTHHGMRSDRHMHRQACPSRTHGEIPAHTQAESATAVRSTPIRSILAHRTSFASMARPPYHTNLQPVMIGHTSHNYRTTIAQRFYAQPWHSEPNNCSHKPSPAAAAPTGPLSSSHNKPWMPPGCHSQLAG